jgi:hypothetical protein
MAPVKQDDVIGSGGHAFGAVPFGMPTPAGRAKCASKRIGGGCGHGTPKIVRNVLIDY